MEGEAERSAVAAADRAVITRQLGREPRDVAGVAVRCPFGRPAVIETPPLFSTGEPNPTLLYLTCPTLGAAISRLEAQGGVRRLRAAAASDPDLMRKLEVLTEVYRQRRASYGTERRPEAGIGGPPGPQVASCLHAYAAALLAAAAGWLKGPGFSEPEVHRLWGRLFAGLGVRWCADDRCGSDEATLGCGRPIPQAKKRRSGAAGVRRAVIDVGTISVRLLVADLEGAELHTVERRTEITRLGEGLRPGGRLKPEAARRTAAAVLQFAQAARERGAEHIWLVGTSAVREAVDGRTFLARLSGEAAVPGRVLSGAEEAALAYAGVCIDSPEDSLVLDVGGGSTELIRALPREGALSPAQCGDSRGHDRASGSVPVHELPVIDAVSLQLGASRAKERWLLSDPPEGTEITAAYNEARNLLAPLRDRFAHTAGPLVGVAGTVTTLACLDAGLERYEGKLVHGWRLTKAAVDDWVRRLSEMTVDEVAALPCVQSGRAPVLLAGTLIVQAAMEVLGRGELVVSERDLLDGLALCGLPSW